MGEGLDNLKDINKRWMAIILSTVMIVQSFWTFAGIGYAAASQDLNTSNLAKNVVISQFYGGKKDDVVDVYGNDFVELYNPTAEPVSLNGWSIQFADTQKNNWKIALLGTTTAQIPAYGYYLIALGSNGNVGEQLPQPDASETSFKLDNNSGKLVLLNTTQLLSASDPMADVLQEHVVDFVGYDADAYWGSPAPQAGKKTQCNDWCSIRWTRRRKLQQRRFRIGAITGTPEITEMTLRKSQARRLAIQAQLPPMSF